MRDEYQRVERLQERYAKPWRHILGSPEAVREVADAATTTNEVSRHHLEVPLPTVADLDDALSLVADARNKAMLYLNIAELDLVEAARFAGQSWQWIGERLGYATSSAERSAKARHQALRAKFPGHETGAFTLDISEVRS